MRGLRGVGLSGLASPTTSAGCPGGTTLMSTILALNPIAYWPLNELSGTAVINYGSLGVAANGVHWGATPSQIDAPGGTRAPLYNGAGNYTELISAAIAAGVNLQTLTILLFEKVYNVGVWTDGAAHKSILFYNDASNYLFFRVGDTNNQHRCQFIHGGTSELVWSGGVSHTTWVMKAITIDIPGDVMRVYLNDAQWGADNTGLAAMPGLTQFRVGQDGVTANQPWYGYLAHVVVCNSVVALAQIQAIYASALPL